MIPAVVVLALLAQLAGCGESSSERAERRAVEQGAAVYGAPAGDKCEPGRSGAAGYDETMRTHRGIPLTVVTPVNYDATRAHPLLVVFAPAGISRHEVERVTGFTAPATRAGFLVTYAEHPPLGLETTRDLYTAVTQVAGHWCVDPARVYFAGHSDGGTVSHILAVLPQTRDVVGGIAPSGAGVRAADLAAHGCPAPRPVMVSHATADKTFPGWGEEVANWWAVCNRCELKSRPLSDGCVQYEGCDPRGPTRYCATPGGHARWPANADAIVRFLAELPEG